MTFTALAAWSRRRTRTMLDRLAFDAITDRLRQDKAWWTTIGAITARRTIRED